MEAEPGGDAAKTGTGEEGEPIPMDDGPPPMPMCCGGMLCCWGMPCMLCIPG